MTSADDRLTPLSNDPESLSNFAVNIGLDESSFQFAEVFDFDEECLGFIPRPVYSTVFLFPIGDDDGPLESRHAEAVTLSGQVPWFTKQTVANACGTIAIIHSVLNNLGSLKIKSGSWLEKFIAEAKDKSPEDRAKLIEESDDLLEMHEENATVDDTPLTESSFESHFIAFVIVDGKLWELDGRKPQPICHGPSEDVLKDSVSVIKKDFIPHIENPMEISVCAFCGASS